MSPEHLAHRNEWRKRISNLISGTAIAEQAPVLRIHVAAEDIESPCATESELE